MGYLHIENLYKNQTILMFKECYALEKIHGTSAHLHLSRKKDSFTLFSGGSSMKTFEALFDVPALEAKIREMVADDVPCTVYGEAYGGSCQRMSHLYGPDLKFVAFDVRIGDVWLNVPKAEAFVEELGLEFVSYQRLCTDVEILDEKRDAFSVQALRNDAHGGVREGIVLRPLEEMTLNNGSRVIAKHKGDAFKETKSSRKVEDPEKLKVLEDAKAIAEEWVTEERLQHVLDASGYGRDIKNAGDIIKAMQADVFREGVGEIVESDAARKAIGRVTVSLLKTMPQLQEG